METNTAWLIVAAIILILELTTRWAESVRNKREIQTLKAKRDALECARKFHCETIKDLINTNKELEGKNRELANKLVRPQFTFDDDGTIKGFKGHLKLATKKFEESIGCAIDSVKISKVEGGYEIDIHM